MKKNLASAASSISSSLFQCRHRPTNALFLLYPNQSRPSQSIFPFIHHHFFMFLKFHSSQSSSSSSSSFLSSSDDETTNLKQMILHDDDGTGAANLEIGGGSVRMDKGEETLTLNLDHNTVRETISTSYGNDWKRALEFFNWVEEEEKDSKFQHDIHTYNTMIDILGKFFEFDLAWDLIYRMNASTSSSCSGNSSVSGSGDDRLCTSPPRPDHTTFRIMFKRYVSAHMVQEAIDTFDHRLEEFNLKDFTSFSNLIDALCEYKHVIEAEELLSSSSYMGMMMMTTTKKNRKDTMPPSAGGGVKANTTKLYNMMLRGWSKMGWWSKCREFWEEMESKGVSRDIHSYTIYMDILCKSKKPWKAVKLYKELKKNKKTRGSIQLDVVAYNTVVHAVGLSEGVDESIRVFREMLELGCKPNIVTYNTIIKLLCQSGRVKEAYSLLDQMPEKGCPPNVITYQCIFGCLNSPKEILKLFEMMIESGVRPRMETFVMLIRKFGRWGFLRPAFVIWKKMEELGYSPDEFAYSALIDALIQKGMIDMARKYDDEMFERGLSAKRRKELETASLLSVEEKVT